MVPINLVTIAVSEALNRVDPAPVLIRIPNPEQQVRRVVMVLYKLLLIRGASTSQPPSRVIVQMTLWLNMMAILSVTYLVVVEIVSVLQPKQYLALLLATVPDAINPATLVLSNVLKPRAMIQSETI